jgi:hypothetical protein
MGAGLVRCGGDVEPHARRLSVEIAAMGDSESTTLRRVYLGALSMALALSVVECGNVGVGAATGKGTATLHWTPVTQNTDGTPLKNLAGYKVFYGTPAMHKVMVLPDPTLTTYLVSNLPSGTWYFAVAAYTRSGAQGIMSNVGWKKIP